MLPLQTAARVLVVAVLLAGTASAQPVDPANPTPHAQVSLVAGATAVAPGDSTWLAVRIAAEPGWHVYWSNPGDSGLPVRAEWTLPAGATAGPLRFPAPERIDLAGLTSYAHSGTTDFLTRLTVPASATGPLDLSADVRFLICADVCLPARTTVRLSVPVAPETRRSSALDGSVAALPADGTGWSAAATRTGETVRLRVVPPAGADLAAAQFFPDSTGAIDHAAPQTFVREGDGWAVDLAAGSRAQTVLSGVLVAPGARAVVLRADVAGGAAGGPGGGVWAALGLAVLGGILLNVMPCVFPVLSLKLLSFAGSADARAQRRAGLAYGAGVVVSFWALAGVLVALRAGGASLGWGFQLQSPLVIAFLAVLMTGLALNLLGVFEVGGRLASAGGALDRGTGIRGAFASGVLATVVATPCTAPFMGAALGFALAQPAGVAVAVFTALGVGMALPLVALAFVPGLAARLPRPGPWMETVRQALAFPLLATVAWLVWVFANQAGVNGAGVLLLALVFVALAAWLVGRWAQSSGRALLFSRVTAAVVLMAAVAIIGLGLRAEATDGWEPYDAARAEAVVATGMPLFIDATAAWCLSCQVNKRTSLATADVETAFERAGVVRMRADWTNSDPAVTALLTRFGRSGVPMYAWYAGNGAAPRLLPEVLTPGLVLDAIAEASR